MAALVTLPALSPVEVRILARGVRRDAALAAGGLAGYRMAGRTETPRKGKGAYSRRSKHSGRLD